MSRRAGYSNGAGDTCCSYVAVYFNPLLSLTHVPTCLNRDLVAHLVLYWLVSISALLLGANAGHDCTCCAAERPCDDSGGGSGRSKRGDDGKTSQDGQPASRKSQSKVWGLSDTPKVR